MKIPWIKNSKGRPDSMLTFATIAFIVVTLNLFAATIGQIVTEDYTLNFIPMDSGVMGIYLGATFTAYVSRRFTDSKVQSAAPDKPEDDMTEGS